MTSSLPGSLVPRARAALLSPRLRTEAGGVTPAGQALGVALGVVLGLVALATLGGAALVVLAGGGLAFLSVALSGPGGPGGGDGALIGLVLIAGVAVLAHVAWSLRIDRSALRGRDDRPGTEGENRPGAAGVELLLTLLVAAWTGTQLLGGLLLFGVLPFRLVDRALSDAASGYAWSQAADAAVPTAYVVGILVLMVLGVVRAALHAARRRRLAPVPEPVTPR
jgi:hypothetical protein